MILEFQVLPEEIQTVVASFLPVPSIYNLSLVSTQCSEVAYNDECVWKEIALSYGIDILIKDENKQWKDRVKLLAGFSFEPESKSRDSTLVLSNMNRTVTCAAATKWQTIRMKTLLQRGLTWVWEYELSKYGTSGNSFVMFVGIERSTYDFQSEGYDKIIGYNSEGVSIALGSQSVHSRVKDFTVSKSKKLMDFQSGDIVTVVMDMTRVKSSTMKLYKNGEWFITVKDIRNSEEWSWYPALSVIWNQTVSARAGTSFDLYGEQFLKINY